MALVVVSAVASLNDLKIQLSTRMKFYTLNENILFSLLSDMNGGRAMLKAFKNYKGTVAELRGGADAAALILGDFEYCGIGEVDSWR